MTRAGEYLLRQGSKLNLTPELDLDVNAKYNRINTKYITRAYVFIQSGFAYKF